MAVVTARDRRGRLVVEADLSLPGIPNVYAIGDMICGKGKNRQELPGIAPVAIQQGNYVARAIVAKLSGKQPIPFRYADRGTLATIGRSAAVADLGLFRLTGLSSCSIGSGPT